MADDNWQEVMSLVSLTTWTAQNPSEYASCNHVYNGAPNVCAYPTLIYHKEATDIYDADSILYFIDQYNANNITVVNNPPTELVGQINGKGITPDIISINDYLSYWESYNDVVYVEDNYQLALIASTFASLKNAPLVVRGSSLDIAGTFSNKNVYTVGAVTCPTSALSCTSFSDVTALEQEYLSQTNTDKLVLVNYNDLNIALNTIFYPQYTSNPISSLYSSQSISSPFLASAKHELLISTYKSTYSDIDAFLDSKISALAVQPKYLTIVASPESIPMSKDNLDAHCIGCDWQEVDYLYYANIDQDLYPELATGRIFSLSSSDVSAYIARSLYYNKIPHSNNFSMLWPNYFGMMKLQGKSIDQIFSQAGFNQQSIYYDEGYSSMDMHRDLENKFYVNYLDHGFQVGYVDTIRSYQFSAQDIWLEPTFIVSEACLTCAYDQSDSYYKKYLYCAHTIRRGAIMNVGAVESMYNNNFSSRFIADRVIRGEKIGDVMLEFKKAIVTDRLFSDIMGKTDNWYVLLGDPLFSINNNYPANIDKVEVTKDNINNFILLSVPEINQTGTMNLVGYSESSGFYLPPAGKEVLCHGFSWSVGSNISSGDEKYYINLDDSFNINDINDIILIDSNGNENSLNFSDSLYIADIAKTANFTLGSGWDYTLDILIQKNYNSSNYEYNIIVRGILLNNGIDYYNIQPMPAHGFKIIFR